MQNYMFIHKTKDPRQVADLCLAKVRNFRLTLGQSDFIAGHMTLVKFKLLILLRFYFHDAYEQLHENNYSYTFLL